MILGTGGGPPTEKQLSNLEERAIALLGVVAIEGLQLGSHGITTLVDEEIVPSPPTTPQAPAEIAATPNPTKRRAARNEKAQAEANRLEVLTDLQQSDALVANSLSELAASVNKLAEAQVQSTKLLCETLVATIELFLKNK